MLGREKETKKPTINDLFEKSKNLSDKKEYNLDVFKTFIKEDKVNNLTKAEASNKNDKFKKEYLDVINKKKNLIGSAVYTNQSIVRKTTEIKNNQTNMKQFINFREKKEDNPVDLLKKNKDVKNTREEDEKERKDYIGCKKSKLEKELEKIKKQKLMAPIENHKNLADKILNRLESNKLISPLSKNEINNIEYKSNNPDGAFLFDHFGAENITRARDEEMIAINKNKKLQNLLVKTNNKRDTTEEENYVEFDIQNEEDPFGEYKQNQHIGPIKFTRREEDIYRYFKFSREEILEKTLDFNFYKDKHKSNLGNNEHIQIPDKFNTFNHYKYVWISNFFYELKHCLLSGKLDQIEKQKYTNAEVKINLLNKREIPNSNINVYNCNCSKKLDFQRLRIFKENDIFALYREEDFQNKTELGFENKNSFPYFLGILNYEKNLNTDTNDMILKIHSKYSNMVVENHPYSLQILGNLTPSFREYLALIEMDNFKISEVLLNPVLFRNRNKKEINSLDGDEFDKNFKKKKYLTNINETNKFNESQKEAIRKISNMNKKDVFLIQGPPGTGKTHTIIGIISLLYLENPNAKILITAPSNAAIDEISIRIAKSGLLNENLNSFQAEFIRFGLYDRLEKEAKELYSENGKILKSHSIESLIESKFRLREKSITEELDKITFTIEKLENEKKQLEKLNKNKMPADIKSQEMMRNLKELYMRRKDFTLQKRDTTMNKKAYERELLERFRILCTTLNSSGNERLKLHNISYEYLIIDEACQCVEPSSIIPFALNVKKVIMVGDHMQLPATVFSDKATQLKYNRSLFERMIDNSYPRHILTTQYRMETSIRKFVGKTFYEDKLLDDYDTMKKLKTSSFYEIINMKYNLSFFDLKYSREKLLKKSKSYVNDYESEFLIILLKTIHSQINNFNKKSNDKIIDIFGNFSFNPNFNNNAIYLRYAIIAPYKAQVKNLNEAISNKCPELMPYVEINTVDSFQGREQDIVIISTVRSNHNSDNLNNSSGIGFLNDYRRMNVALSRAKLACFIVGNSNTLIQNEYWQKLIDYCIYKESLFPIREDYLNNNNFIFNLLKFGSLLEVKNNNDVDMEDGEINNTLIFNNNLVSLCSSGNKEFNSVSQFKNDLLEINNMNCRYKSYFESNANDESITNINKIHNDVIIENTFLGKKTYTPPTLNILENLIDHPVKKVIMIENKNKIKKLIKKNSPDEEFII